MHHTDFIAEYLCTTSAWTYPGFEFTREKLLHQLGDPNLTTAAFVDGMLFQMPGSSVWLPGEGMPNLYAHPPLSNVTFCATPAEVLKHGSSNRNEHWHTIYGIARKGNQHVTYATQISRHGEQVLENLESWALLSCHAREFLAFAAEERKLFLESSPLEELRTQRQWQMRRMLLKTLTREEESRRILGGANAYLEAVGSYIEQQISICQALRGTYLSENDITRVPGCNTKESMRDEVPTWRLHAATLLREADGKLYDFQTAQGVYNPPTRFAPVARCAHGPGNRVALATEAEISGIS